MDATELRKEIEQLMSDRLPVIYQATRQSALPTSTNNALQIENLKPFILKNKLKIYNESDSNKDLILYHLNKKHQLANNVEDVVCSGKNLLYFSVMFEQSYIDLLEMCLTSISNNTPIPNFDILFITDGWGKSKISELPVISKFNVDYMIVPSVENAPIAAIRKLDIFDYKRINEYGKILFLDVDTLCIKNLNTLFDYQLGSGKLYISFTSNHLSPRLRSPTHGIMYLTAEDAEFLCWHNEVTPFNSGQFLFINSKRMRMHFENVRWLQIAWPSEYFYEQGFMNYYFVLKQLTAPLVDNTERQLIKIIYNAGIKIPKPKDKLIISRAALGEPEVEKTHDMFGAPYIIDTSKQHDDSTVVIHFASSLPNGKFKKEAITSYANANQLHI